MYSYLQSDHLAKCAAEMKLRSQEVCGCWGPDSEAPHFVEMNLQTVAAAVSVEVADYSLWMLFDGLSL